MKFSTCPAPNKIQKAILVIRLFSIAVKNINTHSEAEVFKPGFQFVVTEWELT